MSDIVERLRAHDLDLTPDWRDDVDMHSWMDTADALMSEAADEITRLRQALSEAEQREKDARVQALELAAVHAECHSDDRPGRDRNFDWNDGYIDGCRGAAAAIRALKDEVR